MNISGLHISDFAKTSTPRCDAIYLFQVDFWKKDEFILVCGIILAALIMLFVIVSLLDAIKRKRISNRLFIEYADKMGLNLRERQILMDLATRARLRLAESIFTMGDVFDRAATQMVRVSMAKYGAKRSRYLSAELSMIREKMGFPKRVNVSASEKKSNEPGSKQISEGKKVYLTNPDSMKIFEVESIVTENTSLGLSVFLQQAIECEPGDAFSVRYYSGSVIWEFDTHVIRNKDNILLLQHSDNVRYVNRRRFLRVKINEPAYLAAFPFSSSYPDKNKKQPKNNLEPEAFKSIWEPPKFIPADLIELAGPGLRLVSPMEVKIGDRVIVILKLPQFNIRNIETFDTPENDIRPYKVIEDIGIVKHVEEVEKGFSIAVELTCLSEKNVSEMVRSTNEVSLHRKRIKEIQSEQKQKSPKWEYISETIVG